MDIEMYYSWHGRARIVKTGSITLYVKNRRWKLGYLTFSVEETQINACDMHVSKYYRGRGLGRLMMMALMALAEEVKKPIVLFATIDNFKFYETLGMRQITDWNKWEDVVVKFMNLNPKKKFIEQCSDIDFVWAPSKVRHIRIYL